MAKGKPFSSWNGRVLSKKTRFLRIKEVKYIGSMDDPGWYEVIGTRGEKEHVNTYKLRGAGGLVPGNILAWDEGKVVIAAVENFRVLQHAPSRKTR